MDHVAAQVMNSEFKLPPETHIGNVHLQVSNLDKSLKFYVELLGFCQTGVENGLLALSSSPTGPRIILLTENRTARPKPPRTTGLYHVAIRLPNRIALARLLRRLVDHGFPLQGFANHAVSEAIYLSDPDGNGLELYADLPRKEWLWIGDQIEMTTDPLDVEALVVAGEKDPSSWNGIHLDTDIGHVHLQVGNLPRSEQFYHAILGFNVTQRSYPGALFLAAGDYHHHIGLNMWAGRDAPAPPSDAVGLVSFSVVLPGSAEIRKIQERLRRLNIPFSVADSGNYGVSVIDPDGNAVRILVQKR